MPTTLIASSISGTSLSTAVWSFWGSSYDASPSFNLFLDAKSHLPSMYFQTQFLCSYFFCSTLNEIFILRISICILMHCLIFVSFWFCSATMQHCTFPGIQKLPHLPHSLDNLFEHSRCIKKQILHNHSQNSIVYPLC